MSLSLSDWIDKIPDEDLKRLVARTKRVAGIGLSDLPLPELKRWLELNWNSGGLTDLVLPGSITPEQTAPGPAFSAHLAVTVPAHFTNNAFVKVPLDTLERENPAGIVRLATDDIAITQSGWWQCSAGAFLNTAMAVGTTVALSLVVGGVEQKRVRHEVLPAAGALIPSGSALLYLQRGDVLDVRALQNSGGAVVAQAGPALTYFSGAWIGN